MTTNAHFRVGGWGGGGGVVVITNYSQNLLKHPGETQVVVLYRCPYERSRDYMNFGIFKDLEDCS